MKVKVFIILICILILAFFVLLESSTDFRAFVNRIDYRLKKVDEATNYDSLKKVEDTCRTMIASFISDKMIFEQYNGQAGERQSWADQAKMRANKTAAVYNEYILKNNFIWEYNVPRDILTSIDYIE